MKIWAAGYLKQMCVEMEPLQLVSKWFQFNQKNVKQISANFSQIMTLQENDELKALTVQTKLPSLSVPVQSIHCGFNFHACLAGNSYFFENLVTLVRKSC